MEAGRQVQSTKHLQGKSWVAQARTLVPPLHDAQTQEALGKQHPESGLAGKIEGLWAPGVNAQEACQVPTGLAGPPGPWEPGKPQS